MRRLNTMAASLALLAFGASTCAAAALGPADLDDNAVVDFNDYCVLAQYWLRSDCPADPAQTGAPIIDYRDMLVLADDWLIDYRQMVYVQWLGHASVKMWNRDAVIYVDPRRISGSPHDATLVLVTHTHGDHYSAGDITKIWGPQTELIAPADVIASQGRGQAITPGQTINLPDLSVTGVAMYNIIKTNHPKSRNWVGFVIELAGKRVYCAGDTDLTEEMMALENIDLAFLPASGTYTMDAIEAAEATQYILPTLAVPYHWGDIVGTHADALTFVARAACNAKIMDLGEVIRSDHWDDDFSLVAHWPLDEAQGNIAHDVAEGNDAVVHGDPSWLPADGVVRGAIRLDGDDHLSTDRILNPAQGAFSVFAWIKGDMPGQVIVSQQGGMNWLGTDPSDGYLIMELRDPGRWGRQLWSQTVVTDGDWHRVGLVWDPPNRTLYADDLEVAADTQSALASSDAGLYIGANSSPQQGSFFTGLIDDVRIHNRPVKP